MIKFSTGRLLCEMYGEGYIDWLTEETFLEFLEHKGKGRNGFRVRSPQVWKTLANNYLPLFLNGFGHPADEDATEPFSVGCTWVSSDHHFGHKNIIKYSQRPFADLDEMREEMIRRHNEVVQENDTWICVGDFAFLPTAEANEILSRMNGSRKILVIGNHDIHKKALRPLAFDHVCVAAYFEADTPLFEDCTLQFLLTHYPYPEIASGAFNIHGHEHVAMLRTQTTQHFNVNVELQDFAPRRLVDIVRDAESRRMSFDEPRYRPVED